MWFIILIHAAGTPHTTVVSHYAEPSSAETCWKFVSANISEVATGIAITCSATPMGQRWTEDLVLEILGVGEDVEK